MVDRTNDYRTALKALLSSRSDPQSKSMLSDLLMPSQQQKQQLFVSPSNRAFSLNSRQLVLPLLLLLLLLLLVLLLEFL